MPLVSRSKEETRASRLPQHILTTSLHSLMNVHYLTPAFLNKIMYLNRELQIQPP